MYVRVCIKERRRAGLCFKCLICVKFCHQLICTLFQGFCSPWPVFPPCPSSEDGNANNTTKIIPGLGPAQIRQRVQRRHVWLCSAARNISLWHAGLLARCWQRAWLITVVWLTSHFPPWISLCSSLPPWDHCLCHFKNKSHKNNTLLDPEQRSSDLTRVRASRLYPSSFFSLAPITV